MADDKFTVHILNGATPIQVPVDCKSYEVDERGNLNCYRGSENKKVASFKTWDYIAETPPPPP